MSDEQVEAIVTTTLESVPKNATHWSTRSLAAQLGVTADSVWRTWQAFGLQPHRQEKFKLSTDPQFIEKVYDICGLYLNPPERAVVLCVDEKSQIQALDRTRPILPMLPGTPEHKTPKIVRWLAQHPRFVLHFTPTSSSWLNLIERWFGELTTKLLRRGAHPTVRALNTDIRTWIKNWNENSRPYVWTKPAEQILESIARYCKRINQTGH